GIFFAIKTKFFWLRYLSESIKLVKEKNAGGEEGVSPFQAFSMALAGRIGTGNIVGVATAIAAGGPGAVFWMWVLAFFGAGTSLAECTLAQIYKEKKFGEYRGGPAFYMEKALGQKWMGVTFALFCAVGNLLLIPGVHSNSITTSLQNAFHIPTLIGGILLVLLMAVIIFGNVHRIAKVSELVVPFMSVGYILLALVVVGANISKLPETFRIIFSSAFGMDAVFGGIMGSAIVWGVKRGVNSCSAGMGTAPQSAAAAETSHPVKQGMVQAVSVYVDTLLVCTATALMIIITNSYNVVDQATGKNIVTYMGNVAAGAIYAQNAAETVLPGFGSALVAIALFFFAFTSLMAAYYIGETNITYFLGENRSKNLKPFFLVTKIIFLCMVIFGSVKSGGLVWSMNDVGTGFLVWTNLISLVLLSGTVGKAVKDYERQRKQGLNPYFDPEVAGIEHAELWSSEVMKARYKNQSTL
ncbi:MAG TPA: alanine/glycine:cation symporter family protein, partial [Clostridia bacterium]|nr:alanine/glycine:cation symporter family protein [Clostridia bacterium]